MKLTSGKRAGMKKSFAAFASFIFWASLRTGQIIPERRQRRPDG
jgi:hypothetical protein